MECKSEYTVGVHHDGSARPLMMDRTALNLARETEWPAE